MKEYIKSYNDSTIEVYTNTKEIMANNIDFVFNNYTDSFADAKYMILAEQSRAVNLLTPKESRNISFDVNVDWTDEASAYTLKVMFRDENMIPISNSIVLEY